MLWWNKDVYDATKQLTKSHDYALFMCNFRTESRTEYLIAFLFIMLLFYFLSVLLFYDCNVFRLEWNEYTETETETETES